MGAVRPSVADRTEQKTSQVRTEEASHRPSIPTAAELDLQLNFWAAAVHAEPEGKPEKGSKMVNRVEDCECGDRR